MIVTTIDYPFNNGILAATAWGKETPDPTGNGVYAFFGTDGDTVHITNDEQAAQEFISLIPEFAFDYVYENFDPSCANVQLLRVGSLYLFMSVGDEGWLDEDGESVLPESLRNKFMVVGADSDDISLTDCIAHLRDGSGEYSLGTAEDYVGRLYDYTPDKNLVDQILAEFNKHADPFLKEFNIDLTQ